MKYDEQFTIDEYQNYVKSKPIDSFYTEKFVNWKGKTKDTDNYYTEVIANELLQNLSILNAITRISRTKSYKVNSHNKIEINLNSNRQEEIFAKRLAYLNLDYLGKIIDYQIPLKNIQKDKIGKIDLVSYNSDSKRFYLIELKYNGNNETLLRTILEIYTYSMMVDETKLLDDFSDEYPELKDNKFILNKLVHSNGPKIIPTILVSDSDDCNPYSELIEMYSDKRPKLKALALALGIEFYAIKMEMTEFEL